MLWNVAIIRVHSGGGTGSTADTTSYDRWAAECMWVPQSMHRWALFVNPRRLGPGYGPTVSRFITKTRGWGGKEGVGGVQCRGKGLQGSRRRGEPLSAFALQPSWRGSVPRIQDLCQRIAGHMPSEFEPKKIKEGNLCTNICQMKALRCKSFCSGPWARKFAWADHPSDWILWPAMCSSWPSQL